MPRSLLVFSVLFLSLSALGESPVLKNQQEAEAKMLPAKDVTTGWGLHCVSRGGTFMFSDVTREYDMNGNQIGGSSFVNLSSHSGTVAAVPIGDFKLLEEFSYRGTSRGGSATNLNGKVVSVSIQISAGNGTPADMVMQRSVVNLTKTGVPLPAATGAKPGKLLSLCESAKRRFGARLAKPRYDARAGEVILLLLDCLPEKADESYLPATLQGASREQRLENAQKLEKSSDKGGFHGYSRETEIIPHGSRRIPFNGAPAERIN